ncbi:MAG: alginate export family protein [Candidatus Omnitrophica bacterium]|nr:alginate export family protein [Candidatus Omnitrophota bacterium]
MRTFFIFLVILFAFSSIRVFATCTLEIGVNSIFRYENWNYFKFGNYQNSYTFYGIKLKPFVKIAFSNGMSLGLGINMVGLGNLPRNAVAVNPAGFLGLGANYYFSNSTLNNSSITAVVVRELSLGYKTKNFSFKVGRFGFSDGTELSDFYSKDLVFLKNTRISERLIGPFGFTYAERAFDGLNLSYSPKSNISLNFGYFHPTFGAFEISTANRTIQKITVTYFSYNLAFDKNTDFRLFFVNYNDDRNLIKPSNRSGIQGKTNISNIGLHFIKVIQKKNYSMDFIGWYSYQWGKWGQLDNGSNLLKISHKAYAFDIEVGYKLNNVNWKPHFRVCYFHGSGDSNPLDNKHETYFVFLANGRKFALFPLYNQQNLNDLTFQLIFSPIQKSKVRLDYSIISLDKKDDGWYMGSGAFNNSSFGIRYIPSLGSKKLANIFSISVNYDFTSKNSISLFYSVANGKDIIRRIYHSNRASYFFVEINQKF